MFFRLISTLIYNTKFFNLLSIFQIIFKNTIKKVEKKSQFILKKYFILRRNYKNNLFLKVKNYFYFKK